MEYFRNIASILRCYAGVLLISEFTGLNYQQYVYLICNFMKLEILHLFSPNSILNIIQCQFTRVRSLNVTYRKLNEKKEFLVFQKVQNFTYIELLIL